MPTVLALALILIGALAMRVTDLEGARSTFPDLFDEGIRAEQLFLMANGFRPYRDIYAAQGPLLLDTLYPFYRLFGETLGAVRLGVGLLSIVGLIGAYLAARQVGGRLGGLLACALLTLSPTYLEGSRLALAEVPSIAPALLALAFALRYQGGGSRRWLVASALLFGASLLLKPMIAPAGVAIGVAIVLRRANTPLSASQEQMSSCHPETSMGLRLTNTHENGLFSRELFSCHPERSEGSHADHLTILRGVYPRAKRRAQDDTPNATPPPTDRKHGATALIPWRRVIQDLTLYATVIAALTTAVVLVMGPREVFEQLVLYRASATGASGWSARESWKEAIQGPIAGHPSLYVLAVVGAALLLSRAPRRGAPLIAWPLATFALLFVYTPLHPKHLVYLAPPAAVLGGAGLSIAFRGVRGGLPSSLTPRRAGVEAPWNFSPLPRAALAAAAVLLLAWDVATVQPTLARGVQIVVDADDQDLHVFDDQAARTLRALVSDQELVLTDHPYITFLARRMVPPELVDPSRGRTRAGTLTGEVAARSATERDVRVVMFWADRLRRLDRFNQWVEQRYQPVASFGTRIARNRRGKDRTVYLRNDADFRAARAALIGLLERPLQADFADELRLLGVTVDRAEVERGEPFSVTLGWEAIRDVAGNYNLILSLVGPDGQEYAAQEQDLEGTNAGTAGWRAGRWLFRGFMLLPDLTTPPGTYQVVLGLDDTRARRPASLTASPDGRGAPAGVPERVVIGTIQVR